MRTTTFTRCAQRTLSHLIRYSALRACAVSDSPRASTEALLPSSDAPSGEQKMIDERFWKSVSYTHLDVYKRQAESLPME